MNKKQKKTGGKSGNLSRRSFLGTVGTAAGAFTIIPNHAMAGRGHLQPSDTVNVAGIGVGAQGGGDIQRICSPDVPIVRPQRTQTGQPLTQAQIAEQAAQQAARQAQQPAQQQPAQQQPAQQQQAPIKLANIYALCDVDTNYSAHVLAGYPKAKKYTDWRKMLEKEKSIDAVVIGTPDHNHAPIAAAFMRQKKHVYVEKPMCKTIYEARKLAELAKQYDVVTQMGNQGHASEGTRRTVEWIQSGVVGLVTELHVNASVPSWPQGNLPRPPAVKVPRNLDWDVWLGPAPLKPYNPDLCHFNWRGLWDYGTGAMGDFGAHILDAAIWALELGMPTKIHGTSTPYSTEYMPSGEMVTYEFPARKHLPPVKVTWYDGRLKPPRPSELEDGRRIGAAVYYGDKGIMMHGTHGAMPELVPADAGFVGPDPWLPRTANNYEDWIQAIKEGKKSNNDFAISAKLTEIMLLTNLAVQVQRSNVTLEYDAENMKITNLPEANNYFHYEYRQGWTL